jgi:hypothetical protein
MIVLLNMPSPPTVSLTKWEINGRLYCRDILVLAVLHIFFMSVDWVVIARINSVLTLPSPSFQFRKAISLLSFVWWHSWYEIVILSCLQMELYGAEIDQKYHWSLGGRPHILMDGYQIPLAFLNCLPYLHCQTTAGGKVSIHSPSDYDLWSRFGSQNI